MNSRSCLGRARPKDFAGLIQPSGQLSPTFIHSCAKSMNNQVINPLQRSLPSLPPFPLYLHSPLPAYSVSGTLPSSGLVRVPSPLRTCALVPEICEVCSLTSFRSSSFPLPLTLSSTPCFAFFPPRPESSGRMDFDLLASLPRVWGSAAHSRSLPAYRCCNMSVNDVLERSS